MENCEIETKTLQNPSNIPQNQTSDNSKLTIKSEEDRIRALLLKNVHKVISRSSDQFDAILNIVKNQHQWENKLDNINQFKVTRREKTKALLLKVQLKTRKNWYTISWRKGGEKKRKEANPLQSAFRNAIKGQIIKWRRQHAKGGAKCVKCQNENLKNLQVDHEEPQFVKLTYSFMELPKNKETIPTEFDYCGTKGRKFKKEDYLFCNRWKTYHKKHATLQWLCKKCNLSKKKCLTKNLKSEESQTSN